MEKNNKQIMTTNNVKKREIYFQCIEKTKQGQIKIPESTQIRILFVQKGVCLFSCAMHVDMMLESKSIVLIPPHNKCILKTTGSVQLILMGMTVDMHFCNNVPLEKLLEVEGVIKSRYKQYEISALKINKIMSDYLAHVKQCLSSGLNDPEFFQMKQRELLYYFGHFYTSDELYLFFKPILTKDIAFSRKFYQINETCHNISDMAENMGYSLSGFKKHFKLIFGVPAYQWLCMEKAKKLFHEITCSRVTFTQISKDFKFSSPAHLNNFCLKMLGDTPGNIRAKKTLSTL
ncbi:MAG: AraC family transcriptional regulator [Prevotellaceae bacterium]|jgi:AraC-like DNA-binding protein|nr:AraC family transcriptional regulator [Prevotellaceae bacterium]